MKKCTLKMNAISLSLLALTWTLAYSTDCPSPRDVSPCSCHEENENVDVGLYCTDKDTTLEQLKNALNALKGHKGIAVELNGLNLGTVPSNFFQGYNVKKLDISNCVLDSLSGGSRPLVGLEDTLEELTISSSFTGDKEAAKLTLSHLTALRELDISFNSITELGNDWFKNAPSSLHRITLSNNNIETIGDHAFADIANLEFLTLDGNRFGSISRSMFPNPAKELDTLELDNNALTSLPDDIFTNMPYLTIVSLASNGLLRVSENIWKAVWNKLADIDLRGNPLTCDSHMNWMSQVPTCADVSGLCAAPREKVGQDIPFVRGRNCAFHP